LSEAGLEQLEQNFLLQVKLTFFCSQQTGQVNVANHNSQDLHLIVSSIQVIARSLI